LTATKGNRNQMRPATAAVLVQTNILNREGTDGSLERREHAKAWVEVRHAKTPAVGLTRYWVFRFGGFVLSLREHTEITEVRPRQSKSRLHRALREQAGRPAGIALMERFQAKWIPVRVKKTRQNNKIEPIPIQSERKRL
jgi:hypothetical protein